MNETIAAPPRPVITAWSAVSPFGIGRAAFAEGLRERRRTAAPPDHEEWQTADEQVCLVPEFDIRGLLGKKGTRSMDRATGLAVTTVGRLLDEAPRNRQTATGEDAALVLGTTTGSVQSQMDFTRASFTGEKPYFVDPARFPNAVMNCAAGQSAIWHQLKGPNTTLAGGRAAGLYALKYARRLLDFDRARTVLCGAVEEFSHARSWLDRHTKGAAGPYLGEGCGLLLVEQQAPEEAGQPVLAEILAVELGVAARGEVRSALTVCLRRALRRAEVRPEELWTVSVGEAPGEAGEQERAAVTGVLGDTVPFRPARTGLIGDTGAATVAFQVAELLVAAEDEPTAAGRTALVTAVDRDGAVGCCLIRLRGSR